MRDDYGHPRARLYVPANRRNLSIIGAAVALLVIVSISLARGDDPSTSTGRVVPPASTAAPVAPAVPTSAAPTILVVPSVEGMNAQVAYETLTVAGFKRVTFGSADADDKVVLFAPNWTVLEQSSKPGTQLDANASIILTCTKKR